MGAKWMGAGACLLVTLGTAACDDSWGDGSYGDGCYTEVTCEPVLVPVSGDCGEYGAPTGELYGGEPCVLEQLRAGTTGQVYINISPYPGYCGIQYVAHIIPDRRAVVEEYSYVDYTTGAISMKKAVLRSPGDYQSCLDGGPEGYAACLVNAFGWRSGTPMCECDYCEQPE
jgi:hypothetical protein